MCRMLFIKMNKEFLVQPHLESFSHICQNSKEYQGHGWGIYFRTGGQWLNFKNISPIWDNNLSGFGNADLLLVHARSAFQNQDITIENNMPFSNGRYLFMFNGELHGVKLKINGRTGAHKIFNFFHQLNHDDHHTFQNFTKTLKIIRQHTTDIRAMNILLTDTLTNKVYLSCLFSQDPGYFTLRIKHADNGFIICSEMYPGETGWKNIANDTIEVLS